MSCVSTVKVQFIAFYSWLIMHQDWTNPSYINPIVLSSLANGFQNSRTQLMTNHDATVALGTHNTVDVLISSTV